MTANDVYDFHAALLPSDHLAAIDAFWGWFQKKADELDAHFSRKTDRQSADPNQLIERLKGPWDELMWEFGPSDKGHSLAITAEWNDDNLVNARAFLRRAPSLPRWVFSEVKPSCAPEALIETFEVMFKQPLHIVALTASENATGRVDIAVEGAADEDILFGQAIKLTSLLLGEAEERDWLGMIDCIQLQPKGGLMARLKSRQAPKLDVEGALASLHGAIERSKGKRPDSPYAQTDFHDRPASLFKINDAPEDHPRADLITFIAPDERYGNAAINARRFSSANHSGHGEWFIYLRLPHQDETLLSVDDRGNIEELIHTSLAAIDLGGVVASGTGTQASYIDVALNDVTAGVTQLGHVLKDTPFAPDVTVHFMDPGLTHYAHPLLGASHIVQ